MNPHAIVTNKDGRIRVQQVCRSHTAAKAILQTDKSLKAVPFTHVPSTCDFGLPPYNRICHRQGSFGA